MRTEPVKYWIFKKNETQVVLFEQHMPEDVRFWVIKAFQDAGYVWDEKTKH